MSSNFCPNCGAPVAPGQKFCPACGASIAPAAPQQPAPQQPVYQQPAPQQPVYQQPAQPAYQQPQPAYQQPQPAYQQPQPAYQQPRPAYNPYGPAPVSGGMNNVWALIIGCSIVGLSLVAMLLGILNGMWGFALKSGGLFIGLIWLLCGTGIGMLFLAQRPFSMQLPVKDKVFAYVFIGCFVLAWLNLFMGFSIKGDTTALLIFVLLFIIAAGVFGVLTFLDLFKKLNMLSWGFFTTLFLIFFWFVNSIIFLAGTGWGYMKFTLIFTPIIMAAAGTLLALHYIKAPQQKMF